MQEQTTLALHGGKQSVTLQIPPRKAFSSLEQQAVQDVIAHYNRLDIDPGYGGQFEQDFCNEFSDFMGGGYTNAVATGTGSIFVALAALQLPKGSEIVMTPITDPGALNAVTLQGFKVSLADSKPGSTQSNWQQIEQAITDKTKAIVVVHLGGYACDIDKIVHEAHKRNILVIEDCSQATGALYKNQKIGTFADVAAFSTMSRKSLMSGGSGGLVYTQNQLLHKMIIAHADRGKPKWQEGFEERNASQYLFPALNWNTDEISCAIGRASLARLPSTVKNRNQFVNRLIALLAITKLFSVDKISGVGSPFFLTVYLDLPLLNCEKDEFCQALIAEGIPLNPHYKFVISEWQWAEAHLTNNKKTPNAVDARNRSFNIYVNENYTCDLADQFVAAMNKVAAYYLK
ncbi:glutamine--scyllo-inositol aminotransferase [Pseudoalteromonas citrea]|uniref:Glutamine--scyllo-inositol aminotransferase n=1 Tax=Pseudoalteromonas citrea TaxID=43655 RepID=A0A5S3XVK2_9GAMM|nr:aminotransferase class V-fold PLP-dependent enzyme [Pseudoalteromonas citrea]TMP43492.1 glutamine--scyllo-inositol aminotransferase [Pseudoalteromonas citrea]TMP62109.1 glutamine--scyllo-inositol aminotransferase [Pseudoalteromonas citrea]